MALDPLQAILTVAWNEIVECDIIARDSVSDLLLVVNQAIGYGWQPCGTPITVHGFWYWPMVRFAQSATSGTGEQS